MATAKEALLEADNGNGITPALNFPHKVNGEQSDSVVGEVVTAYSSLAVPAAAITKLACTPVSLD